jgi:Uma2 family endonuclease
MAVETIAPPQIEHTAGERYRFTVEELQRLVELGVFAESLRIELIEGEIVWIAAIGGPYFECVTRAGRAFYRAVGDDALVSTQNAVRLNNHSAPQPDIAIIRDRQYGTSIPAPSDVYLIVEVAVASLAYDRDTKVALYAASAIPEVWIVDLNARVLMRFAEPVDGRYRIADRHEPGARLTLSQLPSATISVSDFFPESAAASFRSCPDCVREGLPSNGC